MHHLSRPRHERAQLAAAGGRNEQRSAFAQRVHAADDVVGRRGMSRRCQGCSCHPRRLTDQAAPASTGLLRQPGGEGFQPHDAHTGRMVRGPQGVFAKVPGLDAAYRALTRVLPLRRGHVLERDGRLFVR